MNRSDIYKEVSNELGYPEEVVKLVHESSWKFIRETMESLPLHDIDTEEEFNKLRVNFNIPLIGKLGITLKRFLSIKKNYKLKQKLYEQDKVYKDGDSNSELHSHHSKEI